MVVGPRKGVTESGLQAVRARPSSCRRLQAPPGPAVFARAAASARRPPGRTLHVRPAGRTPLLRLTRPAAIRAGALEARGGGGYVPVARSARMPVFLSTAEPDFEPRFAAFLAARREAEADVDAEVAAILAEVAARGDAALIEMTARWDRLDAHPRDPRLHAPPRSTPPSPPSAPEDRAALELAAARIRAYHERQLPEDARWTDAAGAELGWRWTPVAAAGLYVPGGLASYPSSVLMNAIPARVAGVERLVICRPDPGRRGQPAGPARRPPRRRRDRLPDRRRPGDRGARLRHRDDRRRSTRSPAPATPRSPRPSARSSAASAST